MKVKELIALLLEENMDNDIAIQVGDSYEHIDGLAPTYSTPSKMVLLVPDALLEVAP